MEITIKISEKRILDLLAGHSGSYSPWLHEWQGEDAIKRPEGMVAHYDGARGQEGSNKGRKRITKTEIAKGLAVMAKIAPVEFGQFMNEQDDDLTFDTAAQCIIFGKLVYA